MERPQDIGKVLTLSLLFMALTHLGNPSSVAPQAAEVATTDGPAAPAGDPIEVEVDPDP